MTRGLASCFCRGPGFGAAADQQGDAALDLAPCSVARVAAPAAKVSALDLVEWHRWQCTVERDLDQSSGFARHIGLSAYPLRTDRLG